MPRLLAVRGLCGGRVRVLGVWREDRPDRVVGVPDDIDHVVRLVRLYEQGKVAEWLAVGPTIPAFEGEGEPYVLGTVPASKPVLRMIEGGKS